MAVLSPRWITHLIDGFDNRSLTQLASALLGIPYASRHTTYDLRQLRRKQITERLPRHPPVPAHPSRPRDRRLVHQDLRPRPEPPA